MTGFESLPRDVRFLAEVPAEGTPPRWVHPEWRARFPWLAQGTTGRGREPGVGDLALFREDPPPASAASWVDLAQSLGFVGMVHARQVHGTDLHVGEMVSPGLEIAADADGHATQREGVLMGITVADCVPVFLVDPVRRATALLHAGWRGAAGGILEGGIGLMGTRFGSRPSDLLLHLGPAICGRCYEVGPEVHEALGFPRPAGPTPPVDLRIELARRALGRGIPPSQVTLSTLCTRCERERFFSHRGGDRGRQVAFLGVRSSEVGLCQECRWMREIRTRKGSRFLLCRRSEEDPAFPRYPALPVLTCRGFQVGPEFDSVSAEESSPDT